MHRFLVPEDAVQGERVVFSAEQAHQLRNVLRLKKGDSIVVFDSLKPTDLVVQISSPLEGRVVEERAQAPEPRTRLVMYPALLQRDKFEPVLQKLTELGAAAIVPVITNRSLVREAPDERRLARWHTIVREATEQCGRGVVPGLHQALSLSDALERASRDGTTIVAYEGESECSLGEALQGASKIVSAFVGPEGGFAPEEARMSLEAGATLVTLGPRVLRTETASPVLAALVLYELGDLSSRLP